MDTIRRLSLAVLILLSCSLESLAADVPPCSRCDSSAEFDARCRLIVAPCDRATLASMDDVLDELFAAGRPVVLYVHGRGREPRKTAKQGIVATLEKQYGVSVLMFNWDSRAFLFNRPVDRARASAPALAETIQRLGSYRERHPETAHIPVSLLVHSMGSIVLKPALDRVSLANANGPIFHNVLVTQSDEDAQEHHQWVGKLTARNAVVLTFNGRDGTLARSNHGRGKSPLGLGPRSPLATNASYLDATGLVGRAHRLFDKGRLHRRVAICQIFHAMLRGDRPNLTGDTIQTVRQEHILVPSARADAQHPCFLNVVDGPDDVDD